MIKLKKNIGAGQRSISVWYEKSIDKEVYNILKKRYREAGFQISYRVYTYYFNIISESNGKE